jgi:uncharacterized protein YecE (DUF72 family)
MGTIIKASGAKRRGGPQIYTGIAGWGLSAAVKPEFPSTGTHLERYAQRLPAVEINSSFYRPHRPATYAKWAAGVPDNFRFSVKVPRTITHGHRLVGADQLLETFLGEATALNDRLGCLLIQLPPSLDFQPGVAATFFAALRNMHEGDAVLEARHATWFGANAQSMLKENKIGGVAADPAPVAAAAEPSGWPGVVYYRLHGSPRMYYSDYSEDYLAALAQKLSTHARTGTATWCIFDNTAAGAAIPDAFELMRGLDCVQHK